MKNKDDYEFALDSIFKRAGIKILLPLFVVSRFLDGITTEILLGREGFEEHMENIIFYSIENHWIGYFISSLIMIIILLMFLFLYNNFKKSVRYKPFSPMIMLGFCSLYVALWLPIINNILLILGIFPPYGLQFHTTFFIVLCVVSFVYGIFLLRQIIQIKKREGDN